MTTSLTGGNETLALLWLFLYVLLPGNPFLRCQFRWWGAERISARAGYVYRSPAESVVEL